MDVERPLHARFSGRDVDGEAVVIEASGLEARVLQHEIDHLDGVLILDRTTREQRKGALRALREGGSYSPPGEEGEEGAERASTASRAPTREDRLPRHLGLRRDASCAGSPTPPTAGAGPHPARPPRGRGRQLQPPPVAEVARELGIELLQAADVNDRGGAGADPRRRAPGRRSSAPSAS